MIILKTIIVVLLILFILYKIGLHLYDIKMAEEQRKICMHELIPSSDKSSFVCKKCGMKINL